MTHTEKLADLIVDSMADEHIELRPLLDLVLAELTRRAKLAKRDSDDYSDAELTFWATAGNDAERIARNVNHTQLLARAYGVLNAADQGTLHGHPMLNCDGREALPLMDEMAQALPARMR